MPLAVCTCIMQAASGRAACTALCITKPGGLTSKDVSSSYEPRPSTLTRLDAVISSNMKP
jgi:hypothetical protein